MYPFNTLITEQNRQKFLDELPADKSRLNEIEINNSMRCILQHFPILEIDPKLDESIRYTNHFIEDFKMPYPAFFINKPFKTEAGVISGIYVYDILEILKLLLEEAIKDDQSEHTYIECLQQHIIDREKLREKPDYNTMQNIVIGCVVWTHNDKIFGEIEDMYSIIKNYQPNLGELSKHEVRSLLKDKLKYAVGIANLITANVDLDNPQNPNRDVRIIPCNRDKSNRRKRTNNRSVIRVFGKLKKNLEQFNNEIRKRGPNNVDAYIVHGHWRHFRNDRFKNKQGETIWIMPFVKGNGRELVSRVVGIKE